MSVLFQLRLLLVFSWLACYAQNSWLEFEIPTQLERFKNSMLSAYTMHILLENPIRPLLSNKLLSTDKQAYDSGFRLSFDYLNLDYVIKRWCLSID